MKVALVHYWLLRMRGGEKVLEALCRMYPNADIFTHVYDPNGVSEIIRRHNVRTTFIARLPFARRLYQRYLPLMPLALEQLDLRDYDLVISSESGPAKGVLVRPDALHVCYCHSPMRYVWDMTLDYQEQLSTVSRLIARPILHYLRIWDQLSAQRVDAFVANSETVARRIRRWYRREATVVHPPVDVHTFRPTDETGDYFVAVGQLVGYKRVDIAVDACTRLGVPLVVIGDGEERRSLMRRAGPTVTFLGWQPTEVVRDHVASCRAVLFPGEEDFGIVPVEAMAAGRPVVAYAKGGAAETLVDGETGVLFADQSIEGLVDGIRRLEESDWDRRRTLMVERAQRYAVSVFESRLSNLITAALDSSRALPIGPSA